MRKDLIKPIAVQIAGPAAVVIVSKYYVSRAFYVSFF